LARVATNELSPSGSAERLRHAAGEHETPKDTFRNRTAVALAIFAVLLALCNLGGENARKRAIIDSVRASDVSISHESAVARQLQFQLSASTLEALAALSSAPANSPARTQIQQTIDQQRQLVAHPPAADPNNHSPAILTEGSSIDELASDIHGYELDAEHAEQQNEYYEIGSAIIEIGIVLGSIAILTCRRWVLTASFVAAAIGVLFGLNGLFLLVSFL